jgi:serine/threonine protein kinase
MSGAWILPRWLVPTGRAFIPAPGLLVAPHLRLVHPCEGSIGNDWVAEHLTQHAHVTLRFALAAHADSPASAELARQLGSERLSFQAQAVARVSDPHLVQILEQGETKSGQPYLVTELLPGPSMRERLTRSGPLSLAEAQMMIEQAAEVLAKAHLLGLCHGHICPEHLFFVEIGGAPFLKLSNFGDAVPAGADGTPGSLSQPYLSPEQLLRATGSSAASDAWALSVTLYELLTMTRPFDAPTEAGISVAICNSRFAPPSQYRADLPPMVDSWFARAFAREVSDRFRSVVELAQGFSLALSAGEALELESVPEDFEDEERTMMKWGVPEEWSGAGRWPAPERAAGATQTDGGGLGSSAAVSAWLSSRSAASAPGLLLQHSPASRVRGRAKGLVLGAVLGASAMLLFWGYQSWSSETDVVVTERNAATPAHARSSTTSVPQRIQELPVLTTDQLPRAPDEPGDDDLALEAGRAEAGRAEAERAEPDRAASTGRLASPAPIVPKTATPAVASSSHHKNVKPASAPADCNPPYYFDANNIRRLKLDCL